MHRWIDPYTVAPRFKVSCEQPGGRRDEWMNNPGSNFTHPIDIFKDKIELATPSESLAQLHNIFLLQTPQNFELPQSGATHILIFCNRRKQNKMRKCTMCRPATTFAQCHATCLNTCCTCVYTCQHADCCIFAKYNTLSHLVVTHVNEWNNYNACLAQKL